jgi:ubiquinone/menaquinone biosynthesis C-methylase UbiE
MRDRSPGEDRILGDTPTRSYSEKLDWFGRFIAPDLRKVFEAANLPESGFILDLGCGTGNAIRLLDDLLPDEANIIGIDLSLPHLQTASTNSSQTFVQADLENLCFGESSFDYVWCCNTINHVADKRTALLAIAKLLRPGGRLVLAQSGFLPEMFFAWDAVLDEALQQATYRYYRERYGLERADIADVRRLVGSLNEAGFADVATHTYTIERTQPLSQADRAYFENSIFRGLWDSRIRGLLDSETADALDRNCRIESDQYWLDRPDFHHLQTLTVCEARLSS